MIFCISGLILDLMALGLNIRQVVLLIFLTEVLISGSGKGFSLFSLNQEKTPICFLNYSGLRPDSDSFSLNDLFQEFSCTSGLSQDAVFL